MASEQKLELVKLDWLPSGISVLTIIASNKHYIIVAIFIFCDATIVINPHLQSVAITLFAGFTLAFAIISTQLEFEKISDQYSVSPAKISTRIKTGSNVNDTPVQYLINHGISRKHHMYKYFDALFLISLFFIPNPSSAVEFPTPEVIKISERVQVLLGPVQHANKKNQGYMINSTVIIGKDGVVLVDPGGTDEVGYFIKQQIKKITHNPITYVINTHSHGDHYLGNIAFPESTIISSEACRDLVIQTGDDWKRLMESLVGREFPNTRPVAASVVYPVHSKTKITLNGVDLLIWVPPGSHTDGDLMVYLPVEKVLIAGDILVNGIVPTMQDGVVKNWISVLKDVYQINAEVYVPGHGELMKRNQVKSLHDAITRFYAGIREGYQNGLSESEIREKLDLTEWENLERVYVIGRNINRAFLEVEQDLF